MQACQQPAEGANIKRKEMKELLEVLREIEANTLLASKKMLTTEDVSKLTGISRIQLRNLRMRREIPYYRKTAKLIYYDRAEIDAWMKANRVMTNDEAMEGVKHG